MKSFITKTVCALLLLIVGVWNVNAQRNTTMLPDGKAVITEGITASSFAAGDQVVHQPSKAKSTEMLRSAPLWDNTNITIINSIISSYWATDGGYIFCADDFDATGMWTIEKVYVSGSLSEGSMAASKYGITIYSDNAGKPGAELFTNKDLTAVSGGGDLFSLALPASYTLPAAGKYWIAVYAVFPVSTSVGTARWNWSCGSVAIGSPAVLKDPANVIGGAPDWTVLNGLVPNVNSLYFSLEGSETPPVYYDPPLSVQASVSGSNVNVTWIDPSFAYNGWITYATSGVVGQVGYSDIEGADMIATIRFTPEDLANLAIKNGSLLSKVQLGMGTELNNVNTMEIKIWQGATSMTNPGTAVCTQTVNPATLTSGEWNEITLTTPVTIDITKELWIGYRVVNTAGYPMGRDAGPVATGKGELICINGTWSTNSSYNIFFNWCIQGLLTDAKGEALVLSRNGVNDKGGDNRATVKRYNVYCDGALVGVTAATSFTHANVPYGTHNYCVSAVYSGGMESGQTCVSATVVNPNPPTFTCASGPSFPYTEKFESATIPNCWTQQSVVGTTLWTFVTAATGTPNTAQSTPYKARYYHTSFTAATARLITPVLNLGCSTEATLSFWHTQTNWGSDQDELRVYYRTSATGTWTLIPGATYTTAVTTWTQRTLTLPNLTSTYYIAFEATGKYGYGVQLDDITISTGGLPVAGPNPGATNVQAAMPHAPNWYTVNLSWTAPTVTTNLIGYNVYRDGFKVSGNTPVSGTTFTDVAPYAGNFTYAVEAVWEGSCPSAHATTAITMEISPCDIPVVSFPYRQGFENNGTNLPMCWTQEQVKGDSLWRIVPAAFGRPGTSHTGIYKAMYRGWNVVEQAAKLITPSINLSAGDASLSFWYTNEKWLDGQDHLRIYYRTSATGEWILLQSLNENVAAWTEVTIELPDPSSDYYIAFEGDTHYGYGIFLDDIRVDGCAVLDELPYAEGFETSFPNFPGCWTQTNITGTANWNVSPASGSGSPSTTHGGTYKALFYVGGSTANVNRLEGPIFELGQVYDYLQFSFWHTQASWVGDIDNLRVYTQTSAGGDWTKIGEYTGAVATWTQRTFDIMNIPPYFRFGFEATNNWGYGVHLDDIKIIGCNKIKDFPWTEPFSTGTNATAYSQDCWINDGGTGTVSMPWRYVTTGTSPTVSPHSAGGMLQFNCYSVSTTGIKGRLITPPVVASTSEKYMEVAFWMYRDNGYATTADLVNLYINATQDITGATPKLTVYRSTTLGAHTETANGWYRYSTIISGANLNNKYVILEGVNAYGNNIYVDDLEIKPYECAAQDLNMVESFEDPDFFPPICWTTTTAGPVWDRISVGQHPAGVSPQDGSQMIRLNAWSTMSGSADMISRGFNTGGKNQVLSFWIYRENEYTYADRIQFYINSTPSATGATAVGSAYHRSWTLAPVETKGNGWYQYYLELPCASMPVAYLILRGTSDWGNDIHVDNIQIGDLCVPPANVQAVLFGDDPIYPNHATITWSAPSITQASLTGYRVFRNGTQIANNLTDLTYTDNTSLAVGTYTYCVAAIYNNACGLSEQVCAQELVVVQPCPTAPVPTNTMATKHTDGWYDVDLSWTDPTLKASLSYANSGPLGAIGASGDFSIAVRFTPADLTACTDGVLSGVTFVPNEPGINYVIKICQGGGDFTPGTQVYTQTVPASALQIGYILNTVTLTSPVTIDVTKDLWIQIDFVGSTVYPAGRDSGPVAKEGYSNLTYYNGAWTTAYQLNSALIYNWCLTGKVTTPGSNPVLGYNVYDEAGNKLTVPQLPESTNTYRVTVPGPGTYQYGVTALYAGTFCESPKAMINFEMEQSICEIPWEVPIVESFDGEKFTPWCWENIAGTGNRLWQRATTGSYPTCTPHSGAGMLFFNAWSYSSGQSALMVSPFFATEDDYTLKFWMYRDNGYLTNADRVNVYVSTTTSIAGLTPLFTVHRSMNLAPAVTEAGWHEYIVQLPTAGMSGAYVILEGVSGYGNNVYVDDIVILNERACDPIQNLAITQPKEGEVHFEWDAPLPSGFTGVKVIRDGLIVAPMVTDLFYTDYTSVGAHDYCFIALYDKPECTEAQVCFTVDVISQCDPVTEVTATVSGPDEVRVSWTSVNALGFVSYALYCDGVFLEETDQTTYLHEGVEPGQHEYSVVVNYNKDCQMSDPAFSEKIFIETCAMATNLQADATAERVILTWEHPDAAKGAKEVVFYESFDTAIPSTWTNTDVDGDAYRWTWADNNAIPTSHSYAGDGCVYSESWNEGAGALNPNNWLISPAITFNGEGTIDYFVAAQDAGYPAEHYGVYVSTTGTNPSDFTLLFEETMIAKAEGTWYERHVPVSGKTVYIAFRHFNTYDNFQLKLDEVSVTKTGEFTGGFSFNIYKDAELIAEGVTEATYTDEEVVEGATYTYCVLPVYQNCQVEPTCVDAEIPACVPIDVTDVYATGNVEAQTAYITWEYAGTGATFEISRNNVKIAETTDMSYTDNIDYDVIYRYCVTPINPACLGGASACDTTKIDTPVGIGEGDLEGLNIFPNPASANVFIKGAHAVQVDIYNAIGQLVETIKSVEGETISKVDVSAYEHGTYIFKVHTADKTIITKPIVVTRHNN